MLFCGVWFVANNWKLYYRAYENMLSKIIQFVKDRKAFIVRHSDDIILLVGVILISLLSFAAGYIAAR